jgi:hypothetical protein
MIAAYARAARLLVDSPRRADWRQAAERSAVAVRTHLWRPDDRRLFRRYRDGDAAVEAFCEDYACLTWGLLELFQTTGDPSWLSWALDLVDTQASLFLDERDGGWFSTTGEDPSVLLRIKEDYDGAEPAAASVTVRNLITLGHLVSDPSFVDRAARTLERYGSGLDQVARVMPLMLSNIAIWHSGAPQVVIAGTRDAADTRALEAVVARTYAPGLIQMQVPPTGAEASLAERLPWLGTMTARDGRAMAYVCRDFTCQAPVTEPEALGAQLSAVARPSLIR